MKTKEKIMAAALDLFSEKGYKAVSMEEIAGKVGIKAPSIYKHFSGKQEIFVAIIEELQNRYSDFSAALKLDGSNTKQDADFYAGLTEDSLVKMGLELFSFFLHDEQTVKFRKLMIMEQYRCPELARLYTEQYFDRPLLYHSQIFALLGQKGILEVSNPELMALQFVSPILQLIELTDREPAREEEAREKIRAHIQQFTLAYGCKVTR